MKKRKAAGAARRAEAPAGADRWRAWQIGLVLLGALVAVFLVYSPALDGPFVQDDLFLPYGRPDFDRVSEGMWRAQRPLLMATFWLNVQLSGQNPFPFHVVNVLLHFVTGGLVYLLLGRLLALAGESGRWGRLLALLGAGLFLLHPIQTEAVAYVASRSDLLSTLFAYAALAVFFRRPEPVIGWGRAAAVLALTLAAVSSKEHAAVLPLLFLLGDWYFYPGAGLSPVVRNWRLYAPLAAGAAAAAYSIRGLLQRADTVGFAVQGVSWYEYFFTQCRAVWLYGRLLILPLGQNVEHDFEVSRSLLDAAAILGLAAIAAMIAAAWGFRRRYPLAGFGLLLALVLMAPTSSFLVIADPVAERRLYLPMLGFLLIAAEFLRRIRPGLRPRLWVAAAAVLLACGWLTHARAGVWGSAVALWRDAVAGSPNKWRPGVQLASAYLSEGRCGEAAAEFARAAPLGPPDYPMRINWALALDCAGRPEEALERLGEAAQMENTAHVHALMGMIYGKHGRTGQALAALDEAERVDPGFSMTYVYRGNLYAVAGDWSRAAGEYRRAVERDPFNEAARQSLETAERNLGPLR